MYNVCVHIANSDNLWFQAEFYASYTAEVYTFHKLDAGCCCDLYNQGLSHVNMQTELNATFRARVPDYCM